MKLSSGLICAVLLVLVQVASSVPKLPRTSIPTKYELNFDFSVSGSRATKGKVTIDIRITEDSDSIVLNSRSLSVKSVKVSEAGTALDQTFDLQPENEFLVINMTSRTLLKNENFTVEIDFNGSLQTNTTKGIYRTSYKLNNSTDRYLVATNFGGREARSAFVCYDESEYKAAFSLIVTCEKAYTVLTASDGETAQSMFLRGTPLISVDNFGFFVSDFEFNLLAGSVSQSFYTQSGDKNLTNFALDNADVFLNELQSYLSYPHGLTKLLHAAIPDISSETIPNYRLILYNAEDVYGDESSHHVTSLNILRTVANAVAHQYFGDLVTHKSEEFSWLTEGFASLFEENLINAAHPEVRIQDFFNLKTLQNALMYDAMDETHQLTYATGKSSPAIVRHKAASVIRMFKSAVGEEIFRRALESYFSVNHHNVVTSENFYQAFEDAIGADPGFSFTDAFKTWELQAGYPVIFVTVAKSGRSFAVTQKAFSEQKSDEDDVRAWYIPLTFTTAGDADFEHFTVNNWFASDKASAIISAPDHFEASQWFIFNKQQLGYYRVNYDTANWNALANSLNSDEFNKIHVLNRAQLIDDSLAFASGGYLDFETFFGILAYLERETEYTPWAVAGRFITGLYSTFGASSELNALVLHLSGVFYDHFSLTGTMPDVTEIYERHSQELAIKLACNAGNENCLDDSSTLLKLYLNDGRKLPEGLEGLIFCNGLKGSSSYEQWNATWDLMQSTLDTTEKTFLIEALACTEDEAVLESYLHTIIEDEVNYSVADRKAVLSAVLNNPAGIETVCNLLLEAQMLVLIKLELDMTLLPVLVEMASSVKTEQQRRIFTDYLNYVTLEDQITATETMEAGRMKQLEPQNLEIFEIVQKIVEALTEETTTSVTTDITTTSSQTTEELTTPDLTTSGEVTTTTVKPTITDPPTMEPTTTSEVFTTSSQTTKELTTPTSTSATSISSIPSTPEPPATTSQITTETQPTTMSQTNPQTTSTISLTPTVASTVTTPVTTAQTNTATQPPTSPDPAVETTTQGASAMVINISLIACLVLLVSTRK